MSSEIATYRHAAAAFHRKVEDALADRRLQDALASTTARLTGSRSAAFAAVPHPERLRDTARAIRARTIARLDHYLARFADEAANAGCHVHWAETAADATGIVTRIAIDCGIRSAVKSKSMVSEEIGLNPALEAAGVRVVETDLGEYVVQIADDRPSHIITPIVHWRRDDVARLFTRTLGACKEEVADVPAMTAFARRRLRAEFLQAGMGISGVNFAVAETGTICLVTNEGNGRLTTTAPRVHVALLGLERIVPSVADLESCLQVLARSATGQALSVYTTLLTGPRRRPGDSRGAESDGPDELHVVIIDNGRTRLLGSDLAEILYCIRCGACLNVCPVYRRIGGHAYGSVYPGPMGSIVTPGLMGLVGSAELAQASSLCGACRDACPVRIDLPGLLLTARHQAAQSRLGPRWVRVGVRVYAWLATRPRLFRLAGRASRRLAVLVARDGWIRRLPGPLRAWTEARDFPAPAAVSFLDAYRRRTRSPGRTSS
ncbi:MAG: LutB/LldF family L-lactate oxidation iron-sulfur protein [Acidobacteriota bacterium]